MTVGSARSRIGQSRNGRRATARVVAAAAVLIAMGVWLAAPSLGTIPKAPIAIQAPSIMSLPTAGHTVASHGGVNLSYLGTATDPDVTLGHVDPATGKIVGGRYLVALWV